MSTAIAYMPTSRTPSPKTLTSIQRWGGANHSTPFRVARDESDFATPMLPCPWEMDQLTKYSTNSMLRSLPARVRWPFSPRPRCHWCRDDLPPVERQHTHTKRDPGPFRAPHDSRGRGARFSPSGKCTSRCASRHKSYERERESGVFFPQECRNFTFHLPLRREHWTPHMLIQRVVGHFVRDTASSGVNAPAISR